MDTNCIVRLSDGSELREPIAAAPADIKSKGTSLAAGAGRMRDPITWRACRELRECWGQRDLDVAAEDLPDASFADQQEAFRKISEENIVPGAVRRYIASRFTERTVVRRENHGFDHFAHCSSRRMIDFGASGK